MSRAAQLFHGKQVVLVLGQDQGVPCFHYVRLAPNKKLLLKPSDAVVNLEDYGEIIAKGFGLPDMKLRTEIEKAYGFEHDPQLFDG